MKSARSDRFSVLWGMILVALVCMPLTKSALAQEIDIRDEVWKPMLEEDGVSFAYIFYREADTRHNGVVIRLINRNDHPVEYVFTVVFRAGESEYADEVTGKLAAGEYKTGDMSGLFWIPFEDERQIDQVGLRGWQISAID